jgi:dTDP-4-amino-4,6-dideoxygalactose transaminase
MRINITKPQFGKEELKAVKEVLDSGWVVQGPKVSELETMMEKFMSVKYAVITSSCTTALHMAMIALQIKPGDEVIVPAFTWVSTANVCEYVGARPVFVDIDLNTFNIDTEKIEKAITKKTKAIMPVHLFGLSANMGAIMKLARKYKLKVVEDAACAIGTEYQGKHVGGIGDIGAFSFHPRKAITAGEGGLYTTNQKTLAMSAVSLRDHGTAVSDFDRHKGGAHTFPEYNIVGYNYRMTDIQAAVGVEQAKKLKVILKGRIAKAKVYDKAFKNHPHLQTPQIPSYSNHAYQSYVLLVKENSPISRDNISKKLAEKGVATRQGTQNVPMLGFYRKKYGYKPFDFSKSYYAEKNTLTIPLYSDMTEKEQNFVIESILELFK